MKPTLFFITGTSGSGKTSIVSFLKKKFQYVHDFDEEGVPESADENWRKLKSNYWISKMNSYITQGHSAILCGQIVPSEIIACSHFNFSTPACFGFIKISEEHIQLRLVERGWNEDLIRANCNWAKYLERDVSAQKCHLVVNADNLTPDQVGQAFYDWIIRVN